MQKGSLDKAKPYTSHTYIHRKKQLWYLPLEKEAICCAGGPGHMVGKRIALPCSKGRGLTPSAIHALEYSPAKAVSSVNPAPGNQALMVFQRSRAKQ